MVSVLDISSEDLEIPSYKYIMKEIFEKQKTLADKYVIIEGMGDLLQKTKTNLDTQKGQVWIKDFIYRAIEEVGESFEVILNEEQRLIKEANEMNFEMTGIGMARPADTNDLWFGVHADLKIHYMEEIIDALHFLVELCIIAGYTHEDIGPLNIIGEAGYPVYSYSGFAKRHWRFVEQITLAGNCLRNKKWKTHHVLTDRKKFKSYLDESFNALISIVRFVGMDDEDIYVLYFKKNKVNQFRQGSKY